MLARMKSVTQSVRRRKAEPDFGKRAKFSKSNHDLGHLVKNCTILSALRSALLFRTCAKKKSK
jgi:hypothetical protein